MYSSGTNGRQRNLAVRKFNVDMIVKIIKVNIRHESYKYAEDTIIYCNLPSANFARLFSQLSTLADVSVSTIIEGGVPTSNATITIANNSTSNIVEKVMVDSPDNTSNTSIEVTLRNDEKYIIVYYLQNGTRFNNTIKINWKGMLFFYLFIETHRYSLIHEYQPYFNSMYV